MNPLLSAPALRRHGAFHSTFLPDDRDVWVWLPPGYDTETTRRYPVFYMQDGQNLFDADTAFQRGQYWRAGETAAALIEDGRLAPLIIVGIANAGERRIFEYTPTADARLGGGLADAYGQLIVRELKPFVDRTYRTATDRAETGIGGSSLGGLVSLYLALARPDVFGRAAVMSPSVWWDHRVIIRQLCASSSTLRPRLWVDMGTAEGRRASQDARRLKTALVRAGWTPDDNLHYGEYKNATHSEAAWAARFGDVLAWLWADPKRAATAL